VYNDHTESCELYVLLNGNTASLRSVYKGLSSRRGGSVPCHRERISFSHRKHEISVLWTSSWLIYHTTFTIQFIERDA
jgi:hypothetical protein